MTILTRNHRWAKAAHEAAAAAAGAHKLDDYAGDVQTFAVNLRRSGLVAALSHAIANGRAPDYLRDALVRLELTWIASAQDRPSLPDLAEAALAQPTPAYMLAVRESLAAAVWLRRAVRAYDADPTGGADR